MTIVSFACLTYCRSMIRRVIAACVGVLMMLLPAPAAWAAASCTFDAGTAAVELSGGDAAILSVAGGAIHVDGSQCGSATTGTTDLITVTDTSPGGDTTVTVDQTDGVFAPGATDEPGSSDEIEFHIDLGDGDGDELVLRGTPVNDMIVVGDQGANLNAHESDGIDVDVTTSGVDRWGIRGGAFNDHLSAGGDPTTGGPLTVPTALDGGPGTDHLIGGDGPDTFDGGAGFDFADYSASPAAVSVSLDGSADDGRAGEGDRVGPGIEAVVGSAHDDSLVGDADPNLLMGGDGNDTLIGGGGDDELRGEAGDDNLDGGPQEDLLIGGPGNDVENGGGFNDTFHQNPQEVYWSTSPVSMPDTGLVTSTLNIPVTPTAPFDVNARIDIDHPRTEDLTIRLLGPSGGQTVLSNRSGNGTPMTGTVFDSETFTIIRNTGVDVMAGRYHPDGTMETFNNRPGAGVWTLEVRDHVSGSVGVINSFSLQVTYRQTDHDGSDRLIGGMGARDLAWYFGRAQPLSVTMVSGADDGQAGENDNIGDDNADVEDLFGGNNNDVIIGNNSAQDLRGMIGDDYIDGLGGDDQIRGRQGQDEIYGGGGADVMNGGPGADFMDGGAGLLDYLRYTGAPEGVTINLATGTSSGGDGPDTFVNIANATGSKHDDVMIGNDDRNVLDGDVGNDELYGGGGIDTLEGGPGDDYVDGQAGNDWARYNPAPGKVTVDLSTGTASGAHGNDILVSMEHILGTRNYGDTLIGNDGPNIIKGFTGPDKIFGMGGNDKLEGNEGFDELDGGPGTDTCIEGEVVSNCELP